MADPVEQQDGQLEAKPKSKMPFIIGGFVVLLGIVITVALMVMGRGSGEGRVITPTPHAHGHVLTFPEPFTVNLAPPDDQYLATANISIEVIPKPDIEETEAVAEIGIGEEGHGEGGSNKSEAIKQIVTEVLQTKTRTEITSKNGRDKIRAQIQNDINAILEKGEVIKVYCRILVP